MATDRSDTPPGRPARHAASVPLRLTASEPGGGRGMLWTVRRLDPGTLHQHIDPMFRAAWALTGSREDAEDLVQDTFTKVLSRPRVIRGDERGYLLQALRNTFYTRMRTASRRPQTSPMPEGSEPVDPRAPAPQLAAEVNEILGAVSELPEDFRLAIVAVDILGLSYGEAAKALDVPEATITTRLYRARQRIAKQFADHPADPPANSREGSDAGGVIPNG